MGVFTRGDRQGRERRDAFPYPIIPSNAEAGGAGNIRSVSLHSADAALQKVAIFAAVNLIANTGSGLPGDVWRGIGSDRTLVPFPRWLADLGGEGHGLSDFLWQLYYCWTLRGNVIGQVVDRSPVTGQPMTIDLAHPDDVSNNADINNPGEGVWRIRGKEVPSERVWHKRLYPTPGRRMGLSPIALHAVTIGEGLSAQNFGMQWFVDGAHPSSILTNSKVTDIDQRTATTVKQRFLAAVRGTREPVVLGGGWDYKQIQIAPGESQFLETQGYTSAECARIYGPGMPEILGYETGNSMTYANIEQRSVDLLKYTLGWWLRRGEIMISSLLPAPQYFEFNKRELLATDTLGRFQSHATALKNGFRFINEIRNDEGLIAVPWGDTPYLPALGPAAAAAAVKTDTLGPDEAPGEVAPTGGQQT